MTPFPTTPFPQTALFTGPGSQPGEEDGASLNYMSMPSGMSTFAMPDLPEPEDTEGLDAAKAVMARVLGLLKGYVADGAHNIVDLGDLDAANLRLIDQVLGEGEVAAIAGTAAQIQESVLAGVWRVRQTDEDGSLRRDLIEVGRFPTTISSAVFARARDGVHLPDRVGPGVFNAPPLAAEINEHVPRVAPGRDPHVINLSLLPHTEEDLMLIADMLGTGPLTVLSRGYGNCRVSATATRNVWWVQFYNSQEALILNTIEITTLPEVVLAAPEDIADSAERLRDVMEVYR